MLVACREQLPASGVWRPFVGYPDSLALAVMDAVWSTGTRYAITTGVLKRYTAHRQRMGGDAAHDGLQDLLDVFESLGGIDGFIDRIGTRNRVSSHPGAALKAEAVHRAATAIRELDIDAAEEFRAAEGTELANRARTAWLAVPGQGSGISWRYLRMLLGLPDVKPDRMVVRFVASALDVDERTLAGDRVVRLVQEAAARLGVDQRALDHAIWTYQSGGQAPHASSGRAEHLKALAHAFIGAAFSVLTDQHVIPTSVFRPFVQAGRDYQGSDVMHQLEFAALESALQQAYPERFADPLKRRNAEFASSYIISFLEAAIARCASTGAFEADSPPVAEAADELIAVLDATEHTVTCCRAVSHLTVASEEPVRIGEVTVYPETDSHDLVQLTWELIPVSGQTFTANEPFFHAPPHALVVTTARGPLSSTSSGLAGRTSAVIGRFLLLSRLLHAGTHQSGWEVTGASTLISGMGSDLRTFRALEAPDRRLERVVRLSAADAPAFAALGRHLDAAVVKRDGMAATSFDTALYHFNRAHEEGDSLDRVVDLATALEAVLTGDDKGEGLSLRLRNRAAALLATPADGGTRIFNDISKLYDLRSRLVHGGSIPEKELRKIITAVCPAPDDIPLGVAIIFAVDRLRDLVRRAFLARLCLAAGPDALWPFNKSTPVDAALADDAIRARWRAHWRGQLAELGMAAAADPAVPGVDPITQYRSP